MSIRTVVYACLGPIVGVDLVWRIVDIGLRVPRLLDAARRQVENSRGPRARSQVALEVLCPDGRVQSGLCQGLWFPKDRSTFSTIGPTLLGFYERPFQARLAELAATRDYDLIVDVGAADGFYAVGLAKSCSHATVIAADTELVAQRATRAMADLNGVGDRVQVTGNCDSRRLVELVADARRALILSDCEGFERQLFPAGSGETLARHDVAIEIHDWLDYEIYPICAASSTLRTSSRSSGPRTITRSSGRRTASCPRSKAMTGKPVASSSVRIVTTCRANG